MVGHNEHDLLPRSNNPSGVLNPNRGLPCPVERLFQADARRRGSFQNADQITIGKVNLYHLSSVRELNKRHFAPLSKQHDSSNEREIAQILRLVDIASSIYALTKED